MKMLALSLIVMGALLVPTAAAEDVVAEELSEVCASVTSGLDSLYCPPWGLEVCVSVEDGAYLT